MSIVTFLKPTVNSIRKSIRGIEDSYNNYWDVLAELVQNSVDAINVRNIAEGKIKIVINEFEKSISVEDNGCGIKIEDVPVLLLPFSTNKENDGTTIGEKGVGLKFVLFQSLRFELKTRSLDEEDGSISIIEDAVVWKNKSDESDLPLSIDKISGLEVGTTVKVTGVDNDEIFSMNIESLKFLLRTRTAVGNVDNLFESVKNIKVELTVIDPLGNKYVSDVPFKYWTPIECLRANEKINLEDYRTWLSEADRTDQQKTNKLKNKVVYQSGSFMHGDVRQIKFWLCYVPKRRFWGDLSVRDNLVTESELEDEDIYVKKHMCFHQPVLTASVKGMPTGIVIPNPKAGKDGYWQNLFIIFEDKQLKFDIGRKAINSSIVSMYQKHLKTLFNQVTNLISKFFNDGDIQQPNYQWDRDETVAKIKALPDLDMPQTTFKKLPSEQEASVCAIFYELIGAKTIKSFTPLISGYKNKYDLYAEFNSHFVTIEFKSHLRNIIKDFDDYTKLFNEIDYIVCWDVNDEDISSLYNVGINVGEANQLGNNPYTKETTHIITLPMCKPIYIIDLKLLLKNSDTNQQ